MIEDLYNLTAPGKVISEKLAMELDDKYRRSLRNEGRNEGIEIGTNHIIKSMLKKNMSYEDIADICGKSISEIKEIENQ